MIMLLTPNVFLSLGKSVTTDKLSPHIINLNNSRVTLGEKPDGRSINISGDTKAIIGNVGYLKTRSLYIFNHVCGSITYYQYQ